MKQDIFEWLREEIKTHKTINESYLFGSFLSKDSFNDIDVLIIFNKWKNIDFINTTKRKFYSKFKTPLHIQGFHISQILEITDFKKRNKQLKEI